tara:strand:- start:165 stop:533 length:369 start_codon:yes stop_codon:yes gene_type:complete
MRILLLLGTNLAVILVASITLRLLGLDSYLTQNGINYQSLLVFAAVIGFGGSFVSLLISKKMAMWSTRAQIIENPKHLPSAGWWTLWLNWRRKRALVCRTLRFFPPPNPTRLPLDGIKTAHW